MLVRVLACCTKGDFCNIPKSPLNKALECCTFEVPKLRAMIWESSPWKDQLILDAEIIQRWASKTRMSARRSTLLERKIFVSAYAIRKLYESYKLSTAFHDRSLACCTYPAKASSITPLSNHRVEKLYDLYRPNTETVFARHLMDIIIHSLVFLEVLRDEDDQAVEAFLVTSDRKRNCLWEIKTGQFVKLMRNVGSDYPSAARWVTNPKTGKFVVWQGNDAPPASFEDQAHRILGI
jgi:hypothetical protein